MTELDEIEVKGKTHGFREKWFGEKDIKKLLKEMKEELISIRLCSFSTDIICPVCCKLKRLFLRDNHNPVQMCRECKIDKIFKESVGV